MVRTLKFMSIAVVAAAMAVFTYAGTALAGPAGCYDITGASTEILVGGVPNSGVFQFDPPYEPSTQYAACVEDTGPGDPGDGPFELKGWVWDDNLGWISLYCNGGFNLGIPCGPYDYGVQLEGLVPGAGLIEGQLTGYAWGDNSGWISFSCENDGSCGSVSYGVQTETVDNACLGEVYGPVPPDASCSPNAPENNFVYAWSDNLGWFDMTGIKMPWVNLLTVAVDVSFEILAPDGVTDANAVDKSTAALADGSELYTVLLHVTRQYDGSPVDPADYNFAFGATWNDTVDLDQIDGSNGDYSTCYGCGGSAVDKPALPLWADADYGSDASYPDAFPAYISSKAPTSSGNIYVDPDTGNESSNETFVLPTLTVPANDLTLESVTAKIIHNASGICVFGGAGCSPQDVMPGVDYDIEFVPPVDLSVFEELTQKAQHGGDSITGRHTVASQIDYDAECSGALSGCGGATITLDTGIDDPQFEFGFDADVDGDPATCTDSDSLTFPGNLAFGNAAFNIIPVFGTDPMNPPSCLEDADQEGEDAYVYSTVNYTLGGDAVSYFSAKLPRVTGTQVVNPVAEIRGNVYSTGVTNPQTGEEVRSLGDLTTNTFVNLIRANVERLVAGVDLTPAAGSVTDANGSTGGFVTSGGVELHPDFVGTPSVYYFEDDVVVGDTNGFDALTGERTIIVKGANVAITSDIFPTTPGTKVGIIALKDYSVSPPAGGNVYIEGGVTDIYANIVAEGSVFSYDAANLLTSGGVEPYFADEGDRFDSLLNQLYIQGSVVSMNTIGGAVSDPPIIGTGEEVAAAEGQYGDSPSGRSRARLYDMNFFRYYGLVFERDANGDAIDQNSDGQIDENDLVPLAGTGAAEASASLTPNDNSATYVVFDPPGSLPGFEASGGVEFILRQ